jgi:hypothetical protein
MAEHAGEGMPKRLNNGKRGGMRRTGLLLQRATPCTSHVLHRLATCVIARPHLNIALTHVRFF